MSGPAMYPPPAGPAANMYGNAPYAGAAPGAAMYPPPAGPAANMYAPNYAGAAPGAAMYPPPAGPAANFAGAAPAAVAYHPLANSAGNTFGNMPNYVTGGYVPPPMPTEPVAPPQPGPVPSEWSIPSLSEEAARAAFKGYVDSHCCYGSSPAEEGVITNTEAFNTFRYRLETFTESRLSEWTHKPHEGEPADWNTQPAPQPWEVPANAPNLFTDKTQELRVPFTSTIKDCHTCLATGKEPCDKCKGNGYKPCSSCNSSGMRGEEACTQCDGKGKTKCSECNAQGKKDCKTCKGKQRLLSYIQVKVEWKNHVEDFVVEQNSGLKAEELQSANGKELFKNSQFLLYPLIGFPNQAIAEASERLIKEHQSKHGQESRILQQRQKVELIPVTKVAYSWKGSSYSYVVYGNKNNVSCNDYPQTCCCCVIL